MTPPNRGAYALVLSTLWIVALYLTIPTFSVSQSRLCTELQTLAETSNPQFTPACLQAMTAGPELLTTMLISCGALLILSLVLYVTDRQRRSQLERAKY